MNVNTNGNFTYPVNKPFFIEPTNAEIAYQVNELVKITNFQASKIMELSDENRRLKEPRRRRSLLYQLINVDEKGYYSLIKTYDTGEKEVKPFFLGSLGKMAVCNVDFVGKVMSDEFFAIKFEYVSTFVLGKKRKAVKGNYLRECFVRAGIMFAEIGDKLICKILNEWLTPVIINCTDRIVIPNLAGWYEGKYLHGQAYRYKSPELLSLPVLKKTFDVDMNKMMNSELYIAAMKKIRNPSARLLLMLYPIAGILSSLLSEGGCRRKFYLNIVWQTDSVNIENVCSYLQIMNRKYLLPYVVQTLHRANCKYILEFKDEVVIMDARQVNDDNSDYTMESNLIKIRRILTGKERIPGTNRQIEAALATITSFAAYGKDVLNLFVEDDFFYENGKRGDYEQAIELFFIHFIKFIQRRMDDISSVIKRDAPKVNHLSDYFGLLWRIYNQFWEDEGIDIAKDTGVADLDFEEIFDTSDYDCDDILDIFCKAVRTGVRSRYMLAVKERKYEDDAIYFDDNCIFIPSQVWQDLLREEKLWRHRNLIKNELKRKGILLTDGEGLTKKLQIDGNRFEVYVLLKSFFNNDGYIAIENLGKVR